VAGLSCTCIVFSHVLLARLRVMNRWPPQFSLIFCHAINCSVNISQTSITDTDYEDHMTMTQDWQNREWVIEAWFPYIIGKTYNTKLRIPLRLTNQKYILVQLPWKFDQLKWKFKGRMYYDIHGWHIVAYTICQITGSRYSLVQAQKWQWQNCTAR